MASSIPRLTGQVVSEKNIQFMRSMKGSMKDQAMVLGGWRRVLNSSYMRWGSYSVANPLDIPDVFDSCQTFSFMGFDDETAGKLWNTYKVVDVKENPAARTPWHFASHYIQSFPNLVDAVAPEDDWIGVMKTIGCSQILIDRLMRPEWTEKRLQGSAKEWITQKTRERWEFLQNFNHLVEAVASDLEVEEARKARRAHEAQRAQEGVEYQTHRGIYNARRVSSSRHRSHLSCGHL